MGKPLDSSKYLSEVVDGVTLYYSGTLQMKPGHSSITVKLRKFFFLRWIELEGAKGTSVYEQE